MTTNHLILDFSHVYCDEKIPKNDKVHWLDCSDITECDLYCSKRAEEEIRARIAPYGIHGIHFLDSGNYHYVTGIMTALIKQKFSLILLDHHTDMQKPMIEQMTSCGDWAGKVLKTNPWLQQLILIGPQESDILQIYREKEGLVSGAELQEKLITFSEEEIQSVEDENKISGIKRNLPVYISIDKDILDEEYSETNWSQGKMPLPVLERLLMPFLTSGNILGIDICGECQQGIPLPQYLEAEKINGETNKELFDFLMHYWNKQLMIGSIKSQKKARIKN